MADKQGKQGEMRKQFCGLLFLLLLMIGLLSPKAVASTTSPSAYLWFMFDRDPEAVQLVGCRDLLCEEFTLLAQSGMCRSTECWDGLPALKAPHRFECAETVCLYAEARVRDLPNEPYFKIVAQFQDQVRSSTTFMPDFRSAIAGYSDRHLNVTTQGSNLRIFPDERMKPTRWQLSGEALAITQISELLLASIFLAWRKIRRATIPQILLTIGFANLLIFPIVWFFFPSLQSFQYSTTRTFGISSIVVAGIFSYFLNRQKSITATSITKLILMWVLSLPFTLLVAFAIAFFVGYHEVLPSSYGISKLAILPMSVPCVVLWKAWFLDRVGEGSFSRLECFLLSLLMTAVSFGLIATLLPTAKQFG